MLYIKEVKPEVFKDISDKDFQAAVLEQQNRINELLKIITNFVLSIEKTGIFSLDELNEELLSTTRYPSIGIDFFVTDDDSFHKELEKCLYNEFIIEDSKKHYYFRGLSNWRTEQGWLRDTSLDGQDTFIRLLDQLGIPRE